MTHRNYGVKQICLAISVVATVTLVLTVVVMALTSRKVSVAGRHIGFRPFREWLQPEERIFTAFQTKIPGKTRQGPRIVILKELREERRFLAFTVERRIQKGTNGELNPGVPPGMGWSIRSRYQP